MRWRLGKVNEYCGAVSVREDKFADPTQVCSFLSFEVGWAVVHDGGTGAEHHIHVHVIP